MHTTRYFLISLLILTGFFVFGQNGTTTVDSIISGGIYRKYRIYVPNIYDGSKPVPLILNLHGYTSNAIQQEFYTNFAPISDTANFLMVYPDGTAPLGSPFWNAGITGSPDDVLFLSELLDNLEQDYNINNRRIYSCGMSNGGIMSYYLACNLSSRITAIASVTGSMFKAWFNTCNPLRPIPVMEIHGTADNTVPYAGDGNFTPIDSVVKKWVTHNNCNTVATTFSVPNSSTSDNSTAVNYKYSGGTNGSTVELYKVTGGSHSWPGTLPIFANTNQDFSASVEIWRFFRQFTLNQFVPNVGIADNKAAVAVSIYPNPSNDFIYLQGLNSTSSYCLFGSDGRQLTSNLTSEIFDIRKFENGIYLIKLSSNHSTQSFRFIKN